MCVHLRAALSFWVGSLLSGCATTPPLAGDPIEVSQIVQRVKCEIWDAVPTPQGQYPTGPYQWMRDWTAKVDLTLETDDTGGITPGVSFVRPLPTATIPGAGTFSQMFSFGLGGGVNTTASRIETLSFTLSFAELRNPQYRGICAPAKDLGLLGDLGLKEWMQAALAPTSGPRPELTQGYHAPPASAAKAAASQHRLGVSQNESDVRRLIENLDATLAQVSDYTEEAKSYVKTALGLAKDLRRTDLTKSPEAFASEVQRAADYIAMTQDAINKAKQQINSANAQQQTLQEKYSQDPLVPPEIKKAKDAIDKANSALDAAAKDATTAQKDFPQNPPIDSIAHQVSFVVTLSGNVTPNWSLARFKGPGTGNTFASASRGFTHTLSIAMGSPSNTGNRVSDDQIRQLDTLQQAAAFRNAIIFQSNSAGAPF
jgi:hypothetical protein